MALQRLQPDSSVILLGGACLTGSPGLIVSLGLITSGVLVIAFSLSHSLVLMMLLWTCHGITAGFGYPPCALSRLTFRHQTALQLVSEEQTRSLVRPLQYLFEPRRHFDAGKASPHAKLVFAALTDWRTSMQFCGLLCILTGIPCLLLLKDYPPGVTPPPPTSAAQVPAISKLTATCPHQKACFPERFCPAPSVDLLAVLCGEARTLELVDPSTDSGRILLYLGSLGLPQDKAVVSAFEFGGLFGAMLCPMAMDGLASVLSNRVFCICLTLAQTGFSCHSLISSVPRSRTVFDRFLPQCPD